MVGILEEYLSVPGVGTVGVLNARFPSSGTLWKAQNKDPCQTRMEDSQVKDAFVKLAGQRWMRIRVA